MTDLVAAEIGSTGPSFEQIALAREVIRRTSPGPRFVGRSTASAVDEWLADRQAQKLQEWLKGSVAEVVVELAYSSGVLNRDGLDDREHDLANAVLKALSNYDLKQV